MDIQLQQKPVSTKSYLVETFDSLEKQFGHYGIMIAGGSVRKALMGESIGKSDIDLFFKDNIQAIRMKQKLLGLDINVKSHPNCKSFTLNKKVKGLNIDVPPEGLHIQMITKQSYHDKETLLGRFDFTVCQFHYTEGQFYFTEQSLKDEQSKTLSLAGVPQDGISPNRFHKYIGMGYTPDVELFEKFFVEGRAAFNEWAYDLDELAGLYDF